jgi:ABC-type sugar transport system ATPase subunit
MFLPERILNEMRGYADEITIGLRPECVTIGSNGIAIEGDATVYAIEPLGSDQFVDVTYANSNQQGQGRIKVRTSPHLNLNVGQPVWLSIPPDDIYVFNAKGNRVFPA